MNTETIALAIPTYNRPVELSKLLDSVPASIAVYVSDNGATLDSGFRSRYPTVTFVDTKPVLPMFSNWNRALQISQGDWIAVTSDDDLYFPGAFEAVQEAIKRHPDASMLVFGHHIIDGGGKVKSTWQPKAEKFDAPYGFSQFKYGVEARMPSIFFRKALLDSLGGFDQEFLLTAADSDIIQKAALVGTTVFIPDVISGYRVWEGGLTHQKIASQEWMREIERWCTNVSCFAKRQGVNMYTSHLHDEIYARNMLSGIVAARASGGYRQAFQHFLECRYPRRALLSTQARLIHRLIRP